MQKNPETAYEYLLISLGFSSKLGRLKLDRAGTKGLHPAGTLKDVLDALFANDSASGDPVFFQNAVFHLGQHFRLF